MAHPELPSEQAYVDRAYERLDELMAANASRLESVVAEEVARIDPGVNPGPEHTQRFERDVMAYTAAMRSGHLDLGDYPLCFGRMDLDTGETYYLGRVAVPGPDHEPLVVDWRAPIAESFYRATGLQPLGLRRRRHLHCAGRSVVDIEDELLTAGELGLAGPGALVKALERGRTAKMRDIVGTVQREQDEVIRAPLDIPLVVQGGPGTGKTAVALHRAAYLLFTHRARLGNRGMLVVGPNPVFLGYIDQVLPALGESGVVLATISTVVDQAVVRGTDAPDAARVKGDARMAEVIVRAVADRQRPLARDATIGYDDAALGTLALRVSREQTERIVRRVRSMGGTHNDRHPHAQRMLLETLYGEYLRVVEQRAQQLTLPQGIRAHDLASPEPEVTKQLWLVASVRRMLQRMWPVLDPQEVVHDLLGSPALIASAARGILTADEQAAIHRPWSDDMSEVAWTDADMPLLEEAWLAVGPRTPRNLPPDPSPDELEAGMELPVFGHIVVDEAQELSPMQLRVLARRSASGSFTLTGDLAQATGHHGYRSWHDLLAHLPQRRRVELAELTISYRTPTEVMGLAARVLRAVDPELRCPNAVRSSGRLPRFLMAPDLGTVVADELAGLDGGTLAVIAAETSIDQLAVHLHEAGVAFARDALGHRVTLAGVSLVKGLEFDVVVVVEPARIAHESPQGLRALYVAVTRATQRLTIMHSEPLPAALASAPPPVLHRTAEGAGSTSSS